ncbi:nitrate reductase associated protein [Synechococcus sp. CS-1324]|uniref:nitrate reductase associated protein n=1 Tax=unclassified Synechococcus TaxID=2626047 RepID=UPI000DB1ADD1|nr:MULTISPECIES: nitrate reductase associated protein [unclassified Synechococcus]MCT0214540.1 nitrate reductase associated protein [Synechococcus sp. CS-1326]MCT0231240.1 nitrate reductase associated protein [Synechococcus sp. CS-1324]MCT0234400.1 nitrate reductase associated protein [Synechococcus sp. CS-1327]PZV03867.1 MAG: hypothetical protein DCF23_08220 [Cyanobium sp.]
MNRHSHCFGFEADFVGELRCIPMAVRRKLDLAGVKLRLNHWQGLSVAERERLLGWPDQPAAIAALGHWLIERTAAMPQGQASLLEPARATSWQQGDQVPTVLADSCEQLALMPVSAEAWAALDELQRFALIKLSHPGHEHRNLPGALREFGLNGS